MRPLNRWISGMVLMLMASGVSRGETLPESAAGRVDGGAKMLREARLLPVKPAHEISPDQLRPIPDGMPVRRYVVGQGLLDGEVAGGTGTEIYRNTLGEFLYPPGAGVQIADDISTNCLTAPLTLIELKVAGGGNGTGPGFAVDFQLYDACPHRLSQPGHPIAGTHGFAVLPNDGTFVVALDLSASPIQVVESMWLAVTFSTSNAGWIVGGQPTIGTSMDLFDGPFPCSTFFGGCGSFPLTPCANFNIRLVAGHCCSSYLSYLSEDYSLQFAGLTPGDMIADDILPLSASGACAINRYEVTTVGDAGPYSMTFELWSDDEVATRPLAPLLGTTSTILEEGNGIPTPFEALIWPPVVSPALRVWMVCGTVSGSGGPLLSNDYPRLGFSDDCVAIFGSPNPGEFSTCSWLHGGCPTSDGVPCGMFVANMSCVGETPKGACCNSTGPLSHICFDGVEPLHCNGRLFLGESCVSAIFDPPCGAAACCVTDGTCQDLPEQGCAQIGGLWKSDMFCDSPDHSCPHPACFSSSQSCGVSSAEPGCDNIGCCELVCELHDYCCTAAWDSTCVSAAASLCGTAVLTENDCSGARVISCGGTLLINNTSATEIGSDPGFSCHAGGPGDPGIGSVWAKFTATATSARLRTCGSLPPADDSLLAIYSGTCGQLTEVGCDDDTLGCGVVDFNSEVCVFGLTIGSTYYIQLASWTEADRGEFRLDLQCPAPSGCGSQPPPPNDQCLNAITIQPGAYSFTTLYSTTDGPGLPPGPFPGGCDEGYGTGIGHDVWYDLIAPGDGIATVDLCLNTDYDSRLVIYEGCQCPAMTVGTHACDDDGCCAPGGVGCASRVDFSVSGGQCYKIRVAGFGSAETGTGTLTLSFSQDPPTPQSGACCSLDGTCLEVTAVECNTGNWIAGQGCQPNICAAIGACCYGDGSCLEVRESECSTDSWTAGQGCQTDTCAVVGACCYGDGCCAAVRESECTDGTWLPKVACGVIPCGVSGACCWGNGGCAVTFEEDCTSGNWSAGQSCFPNLCPPPGACCRGDGSCSEQPLVACQNGQWISGADCTTPICPQPGACCRDNGSCETTLQFQCEPGRWSLGFACDPNPCGACCLSSGDCVSTQQSNCPSSIWELGQTCGLDACPTGSCCRSDGSCLVTTEPACLTGDWESGGDCIPNMCPPAGACCGSQGTCAFVTEDQCNTDLWLPVDSCSPNPCPPVGACCTAQGACSRVTEHHCNSGSWLPINSCLPNPCPQLGACCDTDGSCSFILQASCDTGSWNQGISCVPNSCAIPPTVSASGARYLLIEPNAIWNGPVSLRVTSPDHPCFSAFVGYDGRLNERPEYLSPNEWGAVLATGDEIIPNSRYVLHVFNGVSEAQSAEIRTWEFGDANNNQRVDIDDILCVLGGIGGSFDMCSIAGVDQTGTFRNPDGLVTLDDLLFVLAAFSGQAYPGDAPCP